MSCPVAVTLNSPPVEVAVRPTAPVKFKAPEVVVSTVNAPEATVTFDAPTASKDNAPVKSPVKVAEVSATASLAFICIPPAEAFNLTAAALATSALIFMPPAKAFS